MRKPQTIEKQIDYIWSCLYFVEAADDLTPEGMLDRLEDAARYISSLKERRLKAEQKRKLLNLEKWLLLYDLQALKIAAEEEKVAVKEGRKVSSKTLHHY